MEVGTPLVLRRPSAALEDVDRKRDARLIVVGTYSEGPFKSTIQCSTPHELLHISEVPVLCVPAESPGSR